MVTTMRSLLRRMTFLLPAILLGIEAGAPTPAEAQFGRNKVQFDDFEFRVMESDHFDWYFYENEAEAIDDIARMGERWYERFARTFQHEFEEAKPVILYADHPDFQQTNTLQGFIGEGTGGVTESMKNRIIMPLTGSYWDTDHVLGHEIVHQFQYNIAQARPGGFQGLSTLPLWLIEGMAEYLSVGRDDPLTAMWIRDAIRRDELPTIRQMTRESRFFPYRFGQALWAYIGGTYGDDAVIEVFRRSLRVGFEGAMSQVIGIDTDTLSVRWKEAVQREYTPLMEGRSAPSEQGRLLLAPSTGSGGINISPSLSPDGRYVAFLSEKDLFSVELFVADVATGEIIRRLSRSDADPHIEALRYIDSSGTWSPDSRFFAYVVTAEGDNQLVIAQSDNGQVTDRIGLAGEGIGAIANPAWSPDGRYIAFSGSVGGISDLFLYDLEARSTTRLTNDQYGDFQPAWSPDGRTLAFTSDRGPETNFETLTYSRYQLSTIDVATRAVRVLPVFGNAKHINPQYSPDGESLYFISDYDGFSNIYALGLQDGSVTRVTNVVTGVSGHTSIAPAMSVAGSTAAYTVFDELEFHIYTLDLSNAATQPVTFVADEAQPARRLPPADPDRFSRVATYLADARTGLLPSDTFEPEEAREYSSGLSLDYLGQPTIGVGTDAYGNYVGGGTSAFFSDMLGDKSLSVAIQAQGTFKDIGGVAFYSDLDDRWNWGVGGGRIPYLIPFVGYNFDDPQCNSDPFCAAVLEWTYFRQFVTTGVGQVAYPFSQTQRLELAGGATRYSYDIEVDKIFLNSQGFGYDQTRVSVDAPEPLNMFTGSAAIVGDNASFGFVSPIRGQRYRFEVEQTFGTVDFTTIVADYRRYFSPTLNLTLGFRALHLGRYGVPQDNQQGTSFFFGGPLTPLFIGYETLVRGYAWESFDASECVPNPTQTSSCPTVDRLIGNRIAVSSIEARIPLLGVEQYGLINFPFVPTELVLFTDAGLAWDPDDADLEWSRSSSRRVPVASSGVSARFNVLGILILEAYYAYPWQRPDKGWHWGFQLAPGW
jgi:Tol biopolymer transport system component